MYSFGPILSALAEHIPHPCNGRMWRSMLTHALAVLANGEHSLSDAECEQAACEIVHYLTRDMLAHADETRRSTNVQVGSLATSLTW